MPTAPSLADLRAYAVSRSLFGPTSLGRAITRLGFVQADPIRAPARAQDLILRHRVKSYRAGDLENRYPRLGIEEDFFVNYGYLPRATQALMHPRVPRQAWSAAEEAMAKEVLAFVRQLGTAHPREVDAHFDHGKAANWFGGSTNVTTHLLDKMHFRGLLRVARRDAGTRVYAVREAPSPLMEPLQPQAALDALVDVVVNKYAPLPSTSLSQLLSYLMRGVPQWLALRTGALQRVKARLAHAQVEGVDWYWPATDRPQRRAEAPEMARLLAPFDPVVWDRGRFEIFWAWAYRFEAYTPASRRKLGYYALPLLWRDEVVGWANASNTQEGLSLEIGLVNGKQATRELRRAVDAETARMAEFLAAETFRWSLITS